jgi:hypothetical protein
MDNLLLSTSAYSAEFPARFKRFEKALGAPLWKKRATKLREEIRGNRYLQRYLTEENRIVFALERIASHLAERSTLPLLDITDIGQYEAVTFVHQCVDLFDSLRNSTVNAFVGRVRGCMQNPDDMRGLALEILVATNLIRSGCRVGITDDGTFDWLAEMHKIEFEVECKSLSRDAGQPIHQRPAHGLAHLAKLELRGIIQNLSRGLIIDLCVPGRLPIDHRGQKELGRLIKRSILAAQTVSESQGSCTISEFELEKFPLSSSPDEDTIRHFVQKQLGIRNSWIVCFYAPGKYTVFLSVRSVLSDRVVEAAIDVAKYAADKQLTGHRPGAIFIKFESLTGLELEDVGREETSAPSNLRMQTSQFLSSGRDHIASIIFLADGRLIQKLEGAYTREGVTYTFNNSKSRFGELTLPDFLNR